MNLKQELSWVEITSLLRLQLMVQSLLKRADDYPEEALEQNPPKSLSEKGKPPRTARHQINPLSLKRLEIYLSKAIESFKSKVNYHLEPPAKQGQPP